MKRITRIIILFSLWTIGTLAVLSLIDSTAVASLWRTKVYTPTEYQVLPPSTTAIYETDEFRYTVTTNALGYRGDEVAIQKPPNTIRILTIGDSFTYGWGVQQPQIWPQRVKTMLQHEFPDKTIQVINVAFAGAAPNQYAEKAHMFIPLYQPDIVLVGLVEADDIAQILGEPSTRTSDISAETEKKQRAIQVQTDYAKLHSEDITSGIISRAIHALLPHAYEYIAMNKTVDIKGIWRRQVSAYLSYLDDVGMERYQHIDPVIQQKFIRGQLSPGLLILALDDPDHYIKILNPKNSYLTSGYAKLSSYFLDIQTVAQANNARLYVVDIPHELYVEKSSIPHFQQLGLHTDVTAPNSDVPITSVHKITDTLHVPVIENLALFRATCHDDCFFRYDTHMNAKAHELVAKQVAQILSRQLQKSH